VQAHDFYVGVLGLELVADDAFALVFDLAGTPLRIAKVDRVSPAGYTVLGWQVDDLEATLDALGIETLRYPGLEQDRRGIWASPSGARIAWLADPDGNTLSLTESAP
jgi:catechol 2,3-dioxygenase-like lactoylglutathione lyase family enzyme